MAEDAFGFSTKAVALREMLGRLSNDLPHHREAGIQIEKLNRMAQEFDKKFPWHSVLSMPAKQLRRRQGPYLHRLAQQSKHVDTIMSKMMQELFDREVFSNLKMTPAQRKKLPAAVQRFMRIINQNIHKGTQQLRLQIASSVRCKSIECHHAAALRLAKITPADSD